MKVARWENPENHRYFEIWLGLDLFGALVMVKQWGGKDTKIGGMSVDIFEDETHARQAVQSIHKRRVQHRYVLRSTTLKEISIESAPTTPPRIRKQSRRA